MTGESNMKTKKFYAGIYEINLTIYKTGNMLMTYKNKVSGQIETVYVKNPFLIRYKKDGTVKVSYVT